MNQEIRAQFSLQHFSAGDALQFIMANSSKRKDNGESTDTALPGLSKVAELQAKRHDNEKMHRLGCYDPLCAWRCAEVESHEQLCAHSQTACALAKNAVSAVLHQRIDICVQRYGKALLELANYLGSDEVEDGNVAIARDSAAASLNQTVSALANGTTAKDEDPEATDSDEDIERYMLKHDGFASEEAVEWLQRRYQRCCELMSVRPSAVVLQRLSQCVKPCFADTYDSFFDKQKAASPLSPMPGRRLRWNAKAAQSWMVFPERLVLLSEACAIPYEVNPDLHSCGDIGKQPRHFVAVIGLLEVCRYTVVNLDLSNTGLTDREVRVLCLLCHAHLRRLKVLNISDNPGVTDKVARRLKKMAASLPLLSRLSVQGTSLSTGTIRTIGRLLCRKVL